MRRGEGVCRDLAQIAITLCRALCIPARLVVGYLHELEPMDIHAWFEAFVGGEWYTFDPASAETSGARIAIAHGRDATDVAIYNQYGSSAAAAVGHGCDSRKNATLLERGGAFFPKGFNVFR